MATLAEIRQQHPEYSDMSDDQLAQGLHKKFYSDLPYDDFAKKLGVQAQKPVTISDLSNMVPGSPERVAAEKQLDQQNKAAEQPYTLRQFGQGLLSAGIRPLAKGIFAIPGMAMDLGVGVRNLFPGQNYQLPSSMFNEGLDAALPPPQDMIGKIGEGVNTMIVGGAIPSPAGIGGGAVAAPAGFQSADGAMNALRQQTLREAQAKGYVVPPSTANPTVINKLFESIGGKAATAQQASVKNADVTNAAARNSLGVPDNAVLDAGTLGVVRKNAGDAYNAVRQAGSITTGPEFNQALDKVNSAARGAANSFPKLGAQAKQIDDAVSSVRVGKFDSSDAVDAIGLMRGKADAAYASGDKTLGKAYKDISKALEDEIERGLTKRGAQASDLLKNFREGRATIAKTYSVGKAGNPVTGDISAAALAQQLKPGKPLSGDLLTAARFGSAFPKAGRLMNESVGVDNLNAGLGAMTSMASGNPLPAGWPVLNQAMRAFLLSKAGQKALTGQPGPWSNAYRNPNLIPASYQAGYGLLGQ